jgi:hypothetical protein
VRFGSGHLFPRQHPLVVRGELFRVGARRFSGPAGTQVPQQRLLEKPVAIFRHTPLSK